MAATITGDRGSMDPGEGMNNYCHNSIQSVGIDVSFTDLLNMVAKDAEMSKYPVDGSSQLNEEMLLGGGEDILVEKSISDIETRTGANMEDGIWDGNVNFSMESSPYSQKPTLIEDESIGTSCFVDSSVNCASSCCSDAISNASLSRTFSNFQLAEDGGAVDVTSHAREFPGGLIKESMRKYCEDKKTLMFQPEVGMEFSSTEEAF